MAVFLLYGLTAFAHPATGAELHWSVCENSADQVLTKLNSSIQKDKLREVYFLDQPNLALFARGIILRIRVEKQKVTTTVKTINRPGLDPNLDCENDFYGTKATWTCALHSKISLSQWLAFEGRNANARSIWTVQQQNLIRLVYGQEPNWDLLTKLGPAQNHAVSFEVDSFSKDLVLESMTTPRGSAVLELSTRVSDQDSSQSYADLTHLFEKSGIQICPVQQSKTEQILKAFLPLPNESQ